MTLALIVLVVFLVVWFWDSAKKREDRQAHRKKTITNTKRQDEIWCKNYKMIFEELEKIDNTTPLSVEDVMPAIESLFDYYSIPDSRTAAEKQEAKETYEAAIHSRQDDLNPIEYRYPTDASSIPLPFKIIYYSYPHIKSIPPHFIKPELLFGDPYTRLIIDEFEYRYNSTGRATILTEPHLLICRICNLLTERDLYEIGYNFSWDRQESDWQQTENQIEDYKSNKKKYPWLYR